MNFTVLKSIFKRDFVSYFSNPTGYVFICVFVMLSALAAFWPPEFFGNNLANLDQLSRWMPFILVVFIPAITMSIWAEERRQGTDELLLTLPASDSDVVIGKYLAGVAIFTVALLFSMVSVRLIFSWGLGSPDSGLFFCTYLGYWFIGLAFLATGMVASFLTSNLTVGFILGMLFNAPSAIFGVADWVVKDAQLASSIRQWSAVERFSDFARGVVSFSGVAYFLCVVVVMLYICMVLIGKRHWSGGDDGESRGWHYLARTASLFVLVGGLSMLFANYNWLRADLTSEQVNSLSPSTVELVKKLGSDKDIPPIQIDAYVSPTVPSEYAAQKRELLGTLEELTSIAGSKIQVTKYEVENFSEEATLAERRYGIEARPVNVKVRGTRDQEEIFMGVAFSCGLDKVVIPFLDKGIPVEYELVRSIATVAQQKRQRVGVVKTDVQLFSGFSMQGPTSESQLITELKKQYDVKEVDPSSPITEQYDVLLAVQPSSLGPEQMDNFVAAVKSGQPTAIFEDPFPLPNFYPNVPGTAQPKQPGGGMMGMFGGQQPPQPKGDIEQLWQLLGVRMDGSQLVWQDHDPYPGAGIATLDWVFIDQDNGAVEPFSNESEISSNMRQTLFLYPGSVRRASGADTEFLPLAVTGKSTGTIGVQQVQQARDERQLALSHRPTGDTYTLAALITGKYEDTEDLKLDESVDEEALRAEAAGESGDDPEAEDDATESEDTDEETAESKINVVLVSDIDFLADPFFAIRAMGDDEDALVDWRFQNVTLTLNILDHLAGDDRFIDIRKRTRNYRTLQRIEDTTAKYREAYIKRNDEFQEEALKEIEGVRNEFREKLAEIEGRTDIDPIVKRQLVEQARIRLGRARDVKIARLEKDRNRQIRQSERDLNAQIRGVQDFFKFAAVIVPPILPILLALWVFFRRREQEKEGVSKDRLRYGSAETKPDAA